MTQQLLSTDDVQYYRDNGYFLYKKPIFTPEEFAHLTEIFEEHLANKGTKLSDELDTPHFRDPRLFYFLMHKNVLDLIEPIIGPNIALWSSHFISKDPLTGRATPWHEDSAFWEGRLSEYTKIITVWLAIDKSGKENGCMRVIPGTHNNGFSQYKPIDAKTNTFDSQINTVDESKAVYFELNPGESSLHDSRIIHGATANTSPHRRCGYTMRYFATSARVIPEKNVGFKVWLARGEDMAGNTYQNV